MKKIPLILDCDPGMDDAFALFYSLNNPAFDIRLITTVSGNVSIDKTTRNAQGIVGMANKKVPVASGASRPMIAKPVFAEDVHGETGLGDYRFDDKYIVPLDPRDAVDAMIDVLEASDDKVVIAAVGPLTNIATLLIRYPNAHHKIEKISIMGGGLKGGNTTIAAEFNIYVDPEAANIVFNSGIEIIMAGLDVTEKAMIDEKDLDIITHLGEPGKMLAEMLSVKKKSYLHDVIAMVVLAKPEIFSGTHHKVVVETGGMYTRGMTIADDRLTDRSTEEPVWVLRDLNLAAFKQELFEKLGGYDYES